MSTNTKIQIHLNIKNHMVIGNRSGKKSYLIYRDWQ
jgi:hypothetical protein